MDFLVFMPDKLISKISLGSVQFGMDYGISNLSGKVSKAEVLAILKRAIKVGVRTIDTAQAYGDSEIVLGECGVENFLVGSKISPIEDICDIRSEYNKSIGNLKLGNQPLDSLLFHRSSDLINFPNCLLQLQALKEEKKVSKIGVSVYSPSELERVLSIFTPDIVQLPMNIFDRRFLKFGLLEKLKSKGIEIHSRSTFMQGLLLMDLEDIEKKFPSYRQHFKNYFRFIESLGIDKIQAPLNFMLHSKFIDKVLVGVCSKEQFDEIISKVSLNFDNTLFERFYLDDQRILNPANWNT